MTGQRSSQASGPSPWRSPQEHLRPGAPKPWAVFGLLLLGSLLLESGSAASAQPFHEAFANDPVANGRFIQQTAGTESAFAFEAAGGRLTAVLDVDASPASYVSQAFARLNEASDASFSARFRVMNFDNQNRPAVFVGLMTEQHVGDFGDGLVMVLSLAGGELVAHANIESFDESFTGSAIPIELGMEYLVSGRFKGATRQFALEIFNGPGFTNLAGFSTATLPPGHGLALDRIGLQNSGARDLDAAAGSITLSIDDLAVPGASLRRISIGDATVIEGHSGTTQALFTLSLSLPSSLPLTVGYSTEDGTARAGVDYLAQSGTALFPPGVVSVAIDVPVIGDLLAESSEDFFVNLAATVDATIVQGTGIGAIVDDDPRPLLSLADAAVLEGDSGSRDVQFLASLSAAGGEPITVDYATVNASAIAGQDYVAQSGSLTFAPGTTSQAIQVAVSGDTVLEGDESFFVQLRNPVGAGMLKSRAVGTIFDDDAEPRLSIEDVEVIEGNAMGVAVFTVSLTRPATAADIRVDYSVASGTATVGEDLVASSGTLVFPPGVLRTNISIQVVGDTAPEPDEIFTVSLSNPENATIAKASGLGTIRNDDAFPQVSIADVAVMEGNGGTTSLSVPVRLSFALGRTVTVDYATRDGMATAPADYLPRSGRLTFPAGSLEQILEIPITGDILDEPDETFSVTLSNPVWAALGQERATVTIQDNDPAPSVSVAAIELLEGDAGSSNATFTLTLSSPSAQAASVSYSTADGTAVAGSDYTAKFGTATLPPGSLSAQVAVAVRGDARFEPDESFLLKLENPVNAVLANAEARATILNDDRAPLISVSDAGVTEAPGATVASFEVTLSEPSLEAAVTLQYATAGGSATGGLDFEDTSGIVTLAPRETKALIRIAVLDDLLSEADETFFLNLTGPVNAQLANTQARGIIRDNDIPPKLFLKDAQVIEGDSGRVQLVFPAELDRPSGSVVTAAFATRDGTAIAGSGDYTAAAGQVRFEPGLTNATLSVEVRGDLAIEPDETLVIDLGQLANAGEGRVHAIGTILDDDTRKLVISDAAVREGPAGTSTNAVLRITLNRPSADSVRVRYATADGTATAGSDYAPASGQLVFEPGSTSREVSIEVFGDDVFEPNETALVQLSSPEGAVIADRQGVVTIVNDEDALAIVAAGMTLQAEDCTPGNGVIDPGETVIVRLALQNVGTLPSAAVVGRLLAGQGITPINAAQSYGSLEPESQPISRTFTFKAEGECGQSLEALLQIENGGTNYGIASFPFRLGTLVDGQPVCCQSADLAVTAADAPDPVVVTHDLAYTLMVTNRGPAVATQVMMTNTWRAPVIVRSAEAAPGGCRIEGETVVCDLGTLEPLAGVTVRIVVAPQDTAPLIGVFYAKAAQHEPRPTDNSAIVTTTVTPPAGLSISHCRAQEHSGGAGAQFTIRLSEIVGRPVTVDYATADGTARAGEDYVASRGTATIPAGASTATISIPILDDLLIEPDETFTVTLSQPANASLAAEQTTGTAVIGDDDLPTLSFDDPAIAEPPIGETAPLAFTATLSAAPQRPVTVDFATADETAKGPLDYTPASGRLAFAPGATQAQIQVEIVGDKIPEPAETFFLNFSSPIGARLERTQAKGTILDDSTLPELVIDGVSVIEGPARVNTEAVFKLVLSKPGAQVIEVDYSTLNGTASGGSDFVIGAGTVRFAPGETNATIRIAVHGDDLAEFDETFLVRLSNPRRTSLAVTQAEGTIVNDDYLPLLAPAGSQLRLENCFPPNRAIDPLETVTLDFGLVNRGLGPSESLTAALRATEQIIPLSNPQRYGALTTNGVAVFRPFTFSVNGECGMPFTAELELRDGGRAVGTVSFEFMLGRLADGEFTCCTSADLAVGVRSEPEPVSLLEPLRYVITITNQGPSMATGVFLTNRFSAPVHLVSAGPTPWQATFSDTLLVCEIGELFPGESLRVTNIVAPRELPSLVNSVGVGGVERDPVESNNRIVAANTVVPPAGVSIGDVTISEGDEDHVAEVPLYLWPARSQAVTVGFEFVPGTAAPGEDYVANPGSVTFAPGTTTAHVSLPVIGDLIDEPDETLTIRLRNPVNAPLAREEAVCTIADDDWPALSISSTAINVGTNTSVNALLTVRLSSVFTEPVQVDYFTRNGTAAAGTDYEAQRNTLVFLPGTDALVIRIPLSGNTADERQEEFFVELTNAVNATLPAGPAVVTITDDAPVDLSVSNASATEGDSGQAEAVFTVTLRSSLEQTATVEFFTLDGTARAGSDYLPVQGTLRFAPGTLQQQVAVPIVGDLVSEPVEDFFLVLTNAVNGVIRVPRGTATVTDNDPVPCLSIADLVVLEGDSGTNSVSMILRLSAPSSEMVRVEAVWSNCGASVPGQQGLPEQVVFAPGQTQALLPVPVMGDRVDEPDTVCIVSLTNAVGGAICDGQAQLVIQDDDPAPGLEITDIQVMEGDTGTTEAVFTVSLAGLSAQTVTVQFSTANGTAASPSDYVARSGTLTFPPGRASATVSVSIHGDEAVEPDETFQVVLSQPVNATLFKATGAGTIRNDDATPQTDCPSLVVMATPGDQLCFEPFTPITLIAIPDEAAESLARMEFYSGSTLLGVDTSSPFEITWEGVPPGDYCVTAEAVCPNGSRVRSEPLCLGVTDRGAPVAIVRNFDDPEIDRLRQYLLEMGYCARVFDQETLNFDDLTSYWLVIWDDLGAPGLTSGTVRILRQLFDYGIPIYLIGDRLASAANAFDADARADWAYLLHMNPLGRSGAPGLIEFSKATEDRQPGSILAGRFAQVSDFTYTNTVDFGTVEIDAAKIATAKGADLLVHYPSLDVTDFGQPRSVSQSFRVTTGGEDSLEGRKALFQNAVCWLLRCSFCPLVYLSVQFSELPDVVNTGTEFSFDLTVGNNGECIAFATTVTNHLPAGLSFVNAEFNKGSGVYYNPQDRTLLWRVGSLSSGTENNGILTVTVRAVQPGTFKNSACAVANYELLSESNCAEFELRIEGAAEPEPPELSMIRTGPGTLQLRLSGQEGGQYQIQTSSDLSTWLQWTNVSGPVFFIELPEANLPGNGSRFYRAR